MFTKNVTGGNSVIERSVITLINTFILFFFKLQIKTGNRTGSYYSGGHIARDHIHTVITTFIARFPSVDWAVLFSGLTFDEYIF